MGERMSKKPKKKKTARASLLVGDLVRVGWPESLFLVVDIGRYGHVILMPAKEDDNV